VLPTYTVLLDHHVDFNFLIEIRRVDVQAQLLLCLLTGRWIQTRQLPIEKIIYYRMKSPESYESRRPWENRLAHPHQTARGRKCFKKSKLQNQRNLNNLKISQSSVIHYVTIL
jgi:hypothetical protein